MKAAIASSVQVAVVIGALIILSPGLLAIALGQLWDRLRQDGAR